MTEVSTLRAWVEWIEALRLLIILRSEFGAGSLTTKKRANITLPR